MRHGISVLHRTSLTNYQSIRVLPIYLSIGKCHHQTRWNSSSPVHSNLPDITRKWSTPLAKTIGDAIEATGPVSIAAYMRQCLTNPDGGYYTSARFVTASSSDNKSNVGTEIDPFGRHGDFITSPEISQIFGELVGIWFVTEWLAQGRVRGGIQLIELGPGRGTLMSDILRTITQFKEFAESVESVWLVEAGEGLRVKQKDVLCGEETNMVEKKDEMGKNSWWEADSKFGNIKVRWVEDIALLPKHDEQPKIPFIVAHEFFDALPIHAFESVAPRPESEQQTQSMLLDDDKKPIFRTTAASKTPQWRELLVNAAKRKLTLTTSSESKQDIDEEPEPDFQLTLAKASTPSSLVLPNRPRYKHLKTHTGSRIEISPESARYVQEFARRIGGGTEGNKKGDILPSSKPAGAALIIDYGPLEAVPINSLRGIRKHKIISPFVFAGQADISADVDFGALADAALEASDGVEVHGPVEQGAWLSQLGIRERAAALLKAIPDSDGETRKKEIESGWKRLIEAGSQGMGKAYKVMAILPENGGKRRPVGFGGGVVS